MENPKYLIGIDIASEEHVAAIRSSLKEKPLTLSIQNREEGFSEFIESLSNNMVTPANSLICIEATGVYGEALCYFLYHHGYRVCVEAPNRVKRAFKSQAKTDSVDAIQISEYAWRHFDELRLWKPSEIIVERVKVLLTTREQLVKQLTGNKNCLASLRLKVIQTPFANEILAKAIERLKSDIKEIDNEIKRLIDNDPAFKEKVSILKSIPGVGLLLAANLLVSTNGFSEFLNYKQLASYIGVAPYEYRSGKTVRRRTRSRRNGPSRLRKLLQFGGLVCQNP